MWIDVNICSVFDGFIAHWPSGVDLVNCAVEVVQKMPIEIVAPCLAEFPH